MTTTVYFDPAVGGDASTYSDDNDPDHGMGNGGYFTRFFKVVSQTLAVAAFVVSAAAAAASSAATALAAPGTNATSTANLLIGTGSKAFTGTQAGKSWVVGMWVIAASAANVANFMVGQITAYSGTTLTVNVTLVGGSGTLADWVISITAPAGAFAAVTRTLTAAGLVTGGGNLSADRTFTVTAALAADVRTATDTTKALTASALAGSAAKQVLTDGPTVSWNMASGFNAVVTLGGNRTIAAPTNAKEGFAYALEIIQDATGGRVPSFNAAFDFAGAGTPTLSSAAGKRDILFLYCYDAATPKFRASFSRDS